MSGSKAEPGKSNRAKGFYFTAVLTVIAAVFCLGVFIGRLSLRADKYNFTVTADKPAETVYNSEETEKININTASVQELTQLEGIGEVLAERIIEYRNEHGGFRYTYELMDVKGVGEAKYNAIKDYITLKEEDR